MHLGLRVHFYRKKNKKNRWRSERTLRHISEKHWKHIRERRDSWTVNGEEVRESGAEGARHEGKDRRNWKRYHTGENVCLCNKNPDADLNPVCPRLVKCCLLHCSIDQRRLQTGERALKTQTAGSDFWRASHYIFTLSNYSMRAAGDCGERLILRCPPDNNLKARPSLSNTAEGLFTIPSAARRRRCAETQTDQ